MGSCSSRAKDGEVSQLVQVEEEEAKENPGELRPVPLDTNTTTKEMARLSIPGTPSTQTRSRHAAGSPYTVSYLFGRGIHLFSRIAPLANRLVYKYYCPICFEYYKETFVTSCCENTMCEPCTKSFLQKKLKLEAVPDAVPDSEVSETVLRGHCVGYREYKGRPGRKARQFLIGPHGDMLCQVDVNCPLCNVERCLRDHDSDPPPLHTTTCPHHTKAHAQCTSCRVKFTKLVSSTKNLRSYQESPNTKHLLLKVPWPRHVLLLLGWGGAGGKGVCVCCMFRGGGRSRYFVAIALHNSLIGRGATDPEVEWGGV